VDLAGAEVRMQIRDAPGGTVLMTLARARPLGLGVLQLELPWVQLGLCTRETAFSAPFRSRAEYRQGR
ncbi:hypothetical protein KUT95_09925, partial [Pseudomonas aeruginosa]|nr:hypothetical protein [Pseudomonas aeruginosa]